VRAVYPEGEQHAVTKKEIHLTSLQRKARRVGIWLRPQLGLRKERFEICFMRGSCDNGDFFPFEKCRANIFDRTVASRHKSWRPAVIGIAEIEPRAHVERRRDRSYNGVAIVAVERSDQSIEPTHLHRAGDPKLLANQPGQIHIEPDWYTIRPGV